MTKKEAIHFLYQIADEIQSFLDKTSSPKGQWTSHKRLEALSMAISALYDLFQAEEDGRLIIPPCKVGDTVWSLETVYQRSNHGFRNDVIESIPTEKLYVRKKSNVSLEYIVRHHDCFGKSVFLTKEEAEKAVMENVKKRFAEEIAEKCGMNHEKVKRIINSALKQIESEDKADE